jgi:hypothetical protein
VPLISGLLKMSLEGNITIKIRILVGLRWWNEVKEDGTEVWIFESDHEVRQTSIDTSIFWFSLYIVPVFWAVILVFDIIGFKWMWVNKILK